MTGRPENPIVQRAREHFRGLARVVEVPEWADDAGNPLEIHVHPITLNEKKILAKKADRDEHGALADAIIMKALDAAGDPIFTLEDKHALMHSIDPDVLLHVFNEIMRAHSIKDAAGN